MATPVRSNSKKIELSRSQTEQFISYYHSHDCLWNVGSQFYSRRDHRQASYASIAALMGDCMTVEQVPVKVSALRTYYSKELKKEVQSRKSGAGRDDIYKSSWEWFVLLDPFLRSQVTQKPSTSNMEAPDYSDASQSTEDMAAGPSTPATAAAAAAEDSVEAESPPPCSAPPAPKKKKMDQTNIKETLLNTIKGIERRREERESCSELMFGKYIASEVSSINDERKRRHLKFKIQELIFQFQNED